MIPSGDLTAEALAAVLPGRALRSYPALVSTAAAAFDWARSGAPDGAVIVAEQQLSARGHAGRPWTVEAGRGLGFSVVLRPRLTAEREGWLYTVALAALAEVCGEGASVEWPDRVQGGGGPFAAVAVRTAPAGDELDWAVISVLLLAADPPRGELLAAVLRALEARLAGPPQSVIDDYGRCCATFGRRVRVRFLAGTGPTVVGTAVATLEDGALVLESASGRRAPVRPQDVRALEQA